MRHKILDQKGIYFLTFTVVEWVDLFTRPVYSELLINSMKYCQAKKGLVIYAYVIMSNHMHLIFQAEKENELSNIIQSFKSYTANKIISYVKDYSQPESRRDWLLNRFAFNARKNKTNSEHQVWQRGNHPVLLYSPRMIRQKLNYIHQNPVQARIVHCAEYYVFSSASNYENGRGLIDVTLLEDIWDDMGYVNMGS